MRTGLAVVFPLMAALSIVVTGQLASGDQGRPKRQGIVVDKSGRPVGYVLVELLDGHGDTVGFAWSDEKGEFSIEHRPAKPLILRARLLGVPDDLAKTHEVRRVVDDDSNPLKVEVSVGRTLVLRAEGVPLAAERGRPRPTLVETTSDGKTLQYTAAYVEGAAVFRQIREGLPWKIWIPWTTQSQGTALESGAALSEGVRTIRLETGKKLCAKLEGYRLRSHEDMSSISWEGVFAEREGFRETTQLSASGEAVFSPVVSGVWNVTARMVGQNATLLEARAEIEAGTSCVSMWPTKTR